MRRETNRRDVEPAKIPQSHVNFTHGYNIMCKTFKIGIFQEIHLYNTDKFQLLS